MTMSNKKKASAAAVAAAIIAAAVSLEGGYSNNAKDPGGETNHGITAVVARKSGYEGPMRDLTKEYAQSIYFKDYIEKPGYVPFLTLSHAVSEELVDTAINTGTTRASRWLQISLNAVNRGGKDYPTLEVDGRVGSSTVEAYKSLQRVRGHVQACQLILKLMDAQQANHYINLPHLNTFTVGWVSNRVGNVPLERCKEDAP
jgi:lysozyme family protein